ncbi:hypothetical protein GLOIN_2v1886689 [Rhizophagus clarus]|uniref:Retrotransposon gag domain-containing protein n=1 Tax=Rhizophagus clarus TaxID=94130 RepID=A0A8H3QGT2_9GLOM|nr:hypothetical protein GLOIN_2v1886689 [Rhizophagus clarus]
MLINITRKQTRIGILIQEKFALQILYQRSKAETDLAEFNRAWVFNRYQKWKAREINSRQNILNLQGQIFALQNNLPHIGMAGYAPKRFSDEASRWAEDKLKGKKWRLNHVKCGNALANMAAVVALNNANITAAMINTPDDEDWSLAGGYPIDAGTATNTPNGALNNNNPIVLPDINISQVIYWFKRNYPTVIREQQELIFGTLTQGSDSVRNYYRKIDKYARWARISDREKRIQFIRGLSPENKLEMKRLGLNRPLDDDLIETLEEIETERNNLLLGEDIYNQPATKTKPKTSSHQGITTEDVDRIVNSRIQALQQPPAVQSPASSSGQENITKADLQEAIAKSFQETMSRATKTLDNNSDESSLEEESLDDPMEIDFVKKKELKTSVTTIKCKIRCLKIPAMTLDSGAEPPIITKNIIDHTKDKIDKSEKHDLSGVATVPIESIGIVRNLPITLAPGCTIREDFVVVDYHKPTLIFSNQLLKKYGCAVDWNTNELKIPLNGKDYIIPVTMHKVKNKLKVNCATTTSECDDLSTPDSISQDLSEDGTLKKK